MINLLLVSEFPPDKGAISDYTYGLVNKLHENCRIHIYSISGNEPSQSVPDDINVVGGVRKPPTDQYDLVLDEYDIVHFHNLRVEMFSLIKNYMTTTENPKLVASLHDIPRGWRTRAILLTIRNLIFLSHGTMRRFSESFPVISKITNSYSVPYLGLDEDIKNRVSHTDININIDSRRTNIICSGFIHRKKGVHKVIKAFPLVKNKIPDAHLTIAGGLHRNDDQEYLSEIKQMINSQELDDHVEITGVLPTEDHVNKYILEADVVTLPYDRISQSSTLAKTIALGTVPVVTPLDELIPVIHKYGGIIIDSDTISSLTDGILEALATDNFMKTGKLLNELSWQKNTEQHLSVYNQILS